MPPRLTDRQAQQSVPVASSAETLEDHANLLNPSEIRWKPRAA
jgi:hypothetical protein